MVLYDSKTILSVTRNIPICHPPIDKKSMANKDHLMPSSPQHACFLCKGTPELVWWGVTARIHYFTHVFLSTFFYLALLVVNLVISRQIVQCSLIYRVEVKNWDIFDQQKICPTRMKINFLADQEYYRPLGEPDVTGCTRCQQVLQGVSGCLWVSLDVSGCL